MFSCQTARSAIVFTTKNPKMHVLPEVFYLWRDPGTFRWFSSCATSRAWRSCPGWRACLSASAGESGCSPPPHHSSPGKLFPVHQLQMNRQWMTHQREKGGKKKINNNNNNVGGAMTQPGDKTVTSLQAIKIIIRCNWLGRHGQKWKKRNRWS